MCFEGSISHLGYYSALSRHNCCLTCFYFDYVTAIGGGSKLEICFLPGKVDVLTLRNDEI